MRILLLSTYFRPDIASTGVLMTNLAEDLAGLGHDVTVVTTFPHYATGKIWESYKGKLLHRDKHGPIDVYRLYVYVPRHKDALPGRLFNYATFNILSTVAGAFIRKHDVILTPSPPLTNGLSADLLSRVHRIPFVYNVQDIYPDVAIRMGVMTNPRIIAFFRRVDQYVYRRAAALVVISEGFRRNLLACILTMGSMVASKSLPRPNAFTAMLYCFNTAVLSFNVS